MHHKGEWGLNWPLNLTLDVDIWGEGVGGFFLLFGFYFNLIQEKILDAEEAFA